MKNIKRVSKFYFFCVSIIAFVLTVILYSFGTFSFLENKSYDNRMLITSSFSKVSDDICFIGVNQASLDNAKAEKKWGWPWPREAYSEIVDYLKEGGAAAVVFDVFFSEDSVYGKADDALFAASTADNGKVIQAIFFDDSSSKNVVFPIKTLKDNAAIIASSISSKDSDDIIRKARLYFSLEDEIYPSLGVAPLLLNEDTKNLVEIDTDKTVYLRYKGDINRYAHYSAYDIISSWEAYKEGKEPLIEPENFRDAYVYFMLFAPGLFDICSTPISQIYPGAGVHITLLDDILSNDFIYPVNTFLVYIYFIFCIFLVYLTIKGNEDFSRKEIVFVSVKIFFAFIFIVAFSYALFIFGIWLPLIAPLFCFMISVFAFIIVKYGLEGHQKRFIKTAFRQYLSPAVIDSLIANPYKLKLGGEKRHISIFFSDIQSFTSLSEKLEAEKLAEILNEYLTNMTNIILAHGGTIDKYEGDAIIAFWNAPVEQDNHALRAVESAIECQKYLSDMEKHFTELVGRPLWTRIGVNTGDAVVGNFGSEKRFDYTMLGDSVNLASRLEGLNKQFGTYLMCSKATKEEAERHGCSLKWRELGRVVVVGKKDYVNVFEPIPENLYNEKRNIYDIFHTSLLLFYEGKIEEAMNGFYSISEMDDAAKSYLEKCKSLHGKLKDDWKGLWISNVK